MRSNHPVCGTLLRLTLAALLPATAIANTSATTTAAPTPASATATAAKSAPATTPGTPAAAKAASIPPAPVAPVKLVSETLHGVTVQDPYRYFENIKTPEVQAWLRAQGDSARATLDRIALHDQIDQRISELSAATGDAVREVTRMPGDRIYYMKRPRGEKQYKLMMRVGLTGAEKVLIDPQAEMARTGIPHAVNYYVPSWDGKYMAYGVSAGGSEDASLYILDIASGKLIGQPIPRVHESLVNWLPDSHSLTFNQLKMPTKGEPESETFLDSRVMWLKVGDPETKAKAVFGPTVTKKLGLARLDVGSIVFSTASPWMIARTTDTTLPEGFLFVARVSDIGKADIGWKKISGYEDKITAIELKGDELYFQTHQNAPRKKVMKLDLRKPDLASAVEVAAAPKDGVLEDFALTRDAVIGSIRQGTSIVLRRYTKGNTAGEAIPMPKTGAAAVVHQPAHDSKDVMYSLNSWTEPSRIWLWQGKQTVDSGLRVPPAITGLPELTVEDVNVRSHDGAMVPMTLLYKKGLKRDGNNPTLLDGYAAYGFSETASFSLPHMAWIERGGILAFANVRGSGVYGDDWYKAGFKATKHNTWQDGVACAQYLIDKGYTSAKKLGIMGTSAGGIFVGRTVTHAPELFAAAIFNVGILDAVRAEESANGITNISEYGSAKKPAEFPGLLAMSTYHQIKDQTAYPAVMLVHGLNDPRVDVWHSAKTAARLQAASSSGKPILLRLDAQAGHGIGSTLNQQNAMWSDIFSFLLWQMGHTELK